MFTIMDESDVDVHAIGVGPYLRQSRSVVVFEQPYSIPMNVLCAASMVPGFT